MKLDEILKDKPEAKAEFDEIKTANDAKVKAVVNTERERVTKLINLSGFNLPKDLLNSIESGETLDIFMEKEITARNLKLEKSENSDKIGDFENDKQTPEGEDKSAGASRMDKAVDKALGKKEGGAK